MKCNKIFKRISIITLAALLSLSFSTAIFAEDDISNANAATEDLISTDGKTTDDAPAIAIDDIADSNDVAVDDVTASEEFANNEDVKENIFNEDNEEDIYSEGASENSLIDETEGQTGKKEQIDKETLEETSNNINKAPATDETTQESADEKTSEGETSKEEASTEKTTKEETTKKEIAIKSLKLDVTKTELATNTKSKLNVTVTPEDATEELIFKSSDEKIATVDKEGTVTALRYGTVTITVSNQDGTKKATLEIKTRYYDVNDAAKYYYKPVYWAAEKGITKGYDDVYFGPQRTCTRREMMIFLWRYAGKPSASGSIPFSDVKYAKTSDSYKAILWGSKNGIIKGYGDGTFKPDGSVIRKDAMIMLYRLAGKPKANGTMKFKDVLAQNYSKRSDTYLSILWGANIDITKGYSDGNYKPLSDCLREHIVTFLYRYDNNKTRIAYTPEELVIMLDPGHDSKHPGASSRGYNEYEMNLKIAKACKAELEKYSGVKVLMIRETNACPYPNNASASELRLRVETAKQKGADVYVSLHINASGGRARGIMTIPQVPTKTWRPELSKISTALGEYMRTELMKLGFKSAGTYYRYCTTNYRYPDGTLADYYGICFNATLQNIPAVIIEHGYIDNDDIYLLNSDKKLAACGVADATGIAKYYGLTKK